MLCREARVIPAAVRMGAEWSRRAGGLDCRQQLPRNEHLTACSQTLAARTRKEVGRTCQHASVARTRARFAVPADRGHSVETYAWATICSCVGPPARQLPFTLSNAMFPLSSVTLSRIAAHCRDVHRHSAGRRRQACLDCLLQHAAGGPELRLCHAPAILRRRGCSRAPSRPWNPSAARPRLLQFRLCFDPIRCCRYPHRAGAAGRAS